MARRPGTPAPVERMFVANQTGVIRLGGEIRRYIRGRTILAESDPLRRKFPWRFEPVAPTPRVFTPPPPEVAILTTPPEDTGDSA